MTLPNHPDRPDDHTVWTDHMLWQAVETTWFYYIRMRTFVDNKYGEGYAEKHPEFMASLVKTCAADFNTSTFREQMDTLSNSLDRICSALDGISGSVAERA